MSSQSPAMRLCGSTSSSRSCPSRTVRTGRGAPSRKWITRCVSSASASRRVSTSTAAISRPSPLAGTTTRASSAAGGASPRRLCTSGQTATSTPSMHPDATSRMSHEPSEPSSSTEPDMPERPVGPSQSRGEDVGVGVPAILDGRDAGGWFELYGNGHDSPPVGGCPNVLRRRPDVSPFRRVRERPISTSEIVRERYTAQPHERKQGSIIARVWTRRDMDFALLPRATFRFPF